MIKWNPMCKAPSPTPGKQQTFNKYCFLFPLSPSPTPELH